MDGTVYKGLCVRSGGIVWLINELNEAEPCPRKRPQKRAKKPQTTFCKNVMHCEDVMNYITNLLSKVDSPAVFLVLRLINTRICNVFIRKMYLLKIERHKFFYEQKLVHKFKENTFNWLSLHEEAIWIYWALRNYLKANPGHDVPTEQTLKRTFGATAMDAICNSDCTLGDYNPKTWEEFQIKALSKGEINGSFCTIIHAVVSCPEEYLKKIIELDQEKHRDEVIKIMTIMMEKWKIETFWDQIVKEYTENASSSKYGADPTFLKFLEKMVEKRTSEHT